MFAEMLLGRVTMPRPPATAVQLITADRPKKAWGDGIHSEKMLDHLEERRRVAIYQKANILRVMGEGAEFLKDIAQGSELSQSRTHAVLEELADDGFIDKQPLGRNRFRWVRTEKPLPHHYSTAPRHTPASGESPKAQAGETVFEGEGV